VSIAGIGIVQRVTSLAVALPLLLLGTCVHAASFDCGAAYSKVETMICADSALSNLDERLAEAYARIHRPAADERGEKTLQLAWLKTRNTCTDIACLRDAYESRLDELDARTASPSPITGIWTADMGCYNATEALPGSCDKDERDAFYLAIRTSGNRVCVSHVASAHARGHIDEADRQAPSMLGKMDGNVANVRFGSAFGGHGTATLQIEGNVLHWQVIDHDEGESWIPSGAVLHRVPAGQYVRLPPCR
jgi:uncharacterized protein